MTSPIVCRLFPRPTSSQSMPPHVSDDGAGKKVREHSPVYYASGVDDSEGGRHEHPTLGNL